MAETPQPPRSNSIEKMYAFPFKPPRANKSPQGATQASPARDLYNPAPQNLIRPATLPAAEPGFYVVPRSMSAYDLYHDLFDNMPPNALEKFHALNPSFEDFVKAGSLIVLSDPTGTSCTYAESQLLQAAHQVKAALDPLTPDEADFMHRHAAEIITFTGQSSTWLGVSAAVLETHLSKMAKTLQDIERLHQTTFSQHGHLKSAEFLARRKDLLSQLDAHLLKSTRLRSYTTIADHFKLKSALGISSQSLVHHWKKAGAAGQIPGYANHVNSVSRAAKYMKAGGYIGIGIGGVSGILAIQDVCKGEDAEACRKIRFTEGGKFVGSTAGGYYGGAIALRASGPICVTLGVSGGVPGVICAAIVVGAGTWLGTTSGADIGEFTGEVLYEETGS